MSRVPLAGACPPNRAGRFSLTLALAAIVVTALNACGGGSGGGGGGVAGGTKFHVLLINHSQTDANVTYSGGEPLASSAKPPVKSCKAGVIDYPLTDPFTLSVNDKEVINSASLPAGIPNQGQSDVVTRVDVNKDGSVVFDSVRVGFNISPPAALGICL